jgi:thiamine pyrophosphate-dependent acetolactate synthase large subunit-like protein
MIGRDAFQETDIIGITQPITKHSILVEQVDDLADAIREALRVATEGRPGPVLVDIPKDVQQGKAVGGSGGGAVDRGGETRSPLGLRADRLTARPPDR